MTVCATVCPEDVRGLSFEIEEHSIVKAWAKQNDHRAVVHLEHGVEDEEYEEVIMFLFGVRDRCRFIMWRTLEAVFVQPLIGRRQRYASVQAALEGSLLNKVICEYRRAGTRRYADA